MKWHGFALERAQSPEYWRLPREVIGSHQVALWQCAAAENGGIWRDAAAWSEREWIKFAGIDLAELRQLAEHGLVAWLTRIETQLVLTTLEPSADAPTPEDLEGRWERCRLTREAVAWAVGQCAEGDRSDAPIDAKLRSLLVGKGSEGDRLRSKRCVEKPPTQCFDLSVFDYDFGGQLAAAEKSERAKKMAASRWSGREHQQTLPFATQSSRRNASISKDLKKDLEIDAQAYAQLQQQIGDPPQTPPGGGGGSFGSAGAEGDPRESLWLWLLTARPRALSSDRWGGGKDGAFRTLDAMAASLCVPTATLCQRIRDDLSQKFGNGRWVADMADGRRGFRGYVRDRDFETPAPAQVRALALVPAISIEPTSSPSERGWPGDAE